MTSKNSKELKIPLAAWMVLLADFMLVLIINIDYTAVNIALVEISEYIKSDLNTLQWLISGYVLAWGALVVLAGQFADIYGKRKMLLTGVYIFALASLLCGLATETWQLIAGRALQGFGGALFVPPIYSLLFQSFPAKKQGMAIGMLGVAAGVGGGIGPTFSGIILEYLNWRWIFLSVVPITLLSCLIIHQIVNKDTDTQPEKTPDYVGGMWLGAAAVVFMYTLNQIEMWGWRDPLFWLLMAVAAICFTLFLITQKRQKHPLIPATIPANKTFRSCTLAFGMAAMAFSTVLILMGLYLQNIVEYSPYQSGLIFLSFTVAIGALSPIGGRLTDTMDARYPITLGLILTGLALGLMSFLCETSHLYSIVGVLLLAGIGVGLAFPSTNTVMMQSVRPEELSTASGVFIMAATMCNSFGVIASTSIMVGIGQNYFRELLNDTNLLLTAEKSDLAVSLINRAHRDYSPFDSMPRETFATLVDTINKATLFGFSWVMVLMSVTTLIATVFVWQGLREFKPTK